MNTKKIAQKICKDMLNGLGHDYYEDSDAYLVDIIENRLKKEIKHEKNKKRRKAKKLKFKAAHDTECIKNTDNPDSLRENTYSLNYVVAKLQEVVNCIYTKDDRENFNLSILHQGSDGEYEVFYFIGELSYDSFSKAFDYLNPVVQEIDEDAYFDMEDTGRAVCLISKEKIVEPLYIINDDPEVDK